MYIAYFDSENFVSDATISALFAHAYRVKRLRKSSPIATYDQPYKYACALLTNNEDPEIIDILNTLNPVHVHADHTPLKRIAIAHGASTTDGVDHLVKGAIIDLDKIDLGGEVLITNLERAYDANGIAIDELNQYHLLDATDSGMINSVLFHTGAHALTISAMTLCLQGIDYVLFMHSPETKWYEDWTAIMVFLMALHMKLPCIINGKVQSRDSMFYYLNIVLSNLHNNP